MGKGKGSGRGRPIGPIKHGTTYAYFKRGCHCADCYAAILEHDDKWAKKKKTYTPSEKIKNLPEHPLRKSKKLAE